MELKEAIHYYLGCKYQTVLKTGEPLYLIIKPENLQYILDELKDAQVIKPILRLLEDMTEEEMREYVFDYIEKGEQLGIYGLCTDGESISFYCGISTEWQPDGIAIPIEKKWNIPLFQFTSDEFHYLTQRGFDLFGLIDSGQAIDAKTLQP